ncbi:MAG: hypothetical protein AAGF88_03495 [Pseudomonadota bacterium]
MKKLAMMSAFAALVATAGAADEVTDTLSAAMDAYADGDIQYALDELAYATQLLNDMKADGLEGYLPEPQPGWTMAINDEAAANMGFLGGGAMVEAQYSGGGPAFTITMMADNQMVLSMGAMLGNAQLMAAMGPIERVNRQSFLNQNGELSALIGNRVLIQAAGGNLPDMLAHLETMDFREVEDFGR